MQYDGDAHYGADPYGYPPARSGRRGMLALGGAVVGVAAFAGVIVFAYSSGQNSVYSGVPPLLEADATPTKTRPQDPGGYEVPHQDKLVYERLNAAAPAKPGVERLLPPPEQPLPRPVVSPQVPPLQPAPVVAVADVPVPPAPAAPPPAAAVPAPLPVPVAQLPVVAPAPPASALAPAPPAAGQSSQIAALPVPAKPKPVPPQTAPAPAAAPAKPAATPAKPVPASLTPPPGSVAAAPAPVPASGTLVPPSARPGGAASGRGWRVQLASVPSETQAQGEWRRLSGRHADVLGGLGVSFAQANVNGAIYYRVQAGMVDEARARSICAALKAQNVGCILVAP